MPQQIVILSADETSGEGLAPIGARSEVVTRLAEYNTHPEREGRSTLYGPGFIIDLPPDLDPVNQMLLTIVEDEIAWKVIERIGRELGWKLLNPNTGQELVFRA